MQSVRQVLDYSIPSICLTGGGTFIRTLSTAKQLSSCDSQRLTMATYNPTRTPRRNLMVSHVTLAIHDTSSMPRYESLPLQLGHDRSSANAFSLRLSRLCCLPSPVVQSLLYWVCEPRKDAKMPSALPPHPCRHSTDLGSLSPQRT